MTMSLDGAVVSFYHVTFLLYMMKPNVRETDLVYFKFRIVKDIIGY